MYYLRYFSRTLVKFPHSSVCARRNREREMHAQMYRERSIFQLFVTVQGFIFIILFEHLYQKGVQLSISIMNFEFLLLRNDLLAPCLFRLSSVEDEGWSTSCCSRKYFVLSCHVPFSVSLEGTLN